MNESISRARHLHILNGECVRCGRKLHKLEDVDWYTGNKKLLCIMCRLKTKLRNTETDPEVRKTILERCETDLVERRKRMRMCVECCRPMPPNSTRLKCNTCEEFIARRKEEIGNVSLNVEAHMPMACERCKWKMYHGDGKWSCPSPRGTGPMDRNCMRYERIRLRGLYTDE